MGSRKGTTAKTAFYSHWKRRPLENFEANTGDDLTSQALLLTYKAKDRHMEGNQETSTTI